MTAGTFLVRRKACTLSQALGAGRGGAARALPRRSGWGWPLGPTLGPGESRQRGGVFAKAQGAMALWEEHPGPLDRAHSAGGTANHPLLSVFADRGPGLGPLDAGPDSRRVLASPPSRWRHRLWIAPSPAPPLGWGLWVRRWRVPRTAGPVDEDGAQGPGQRDIGLWVRDAEYCPPLQESRPPQLLVGPSRPNKRPEDPFVVFPGHPPPLGYLMVPPVLAEEHGI